MKISELFPGIDGDEYYLAEMRGHGHPLDPELLLQDIDNYNLNHFTYRNDCDAEIYAEITRRLRRNPLETYNGITGDMFISLVKAPVKRLPEEQIEEIVRLFYDVQYLQDTIKGWEQLEEWKPFAEG